MIDSWNTHAIERFLERYSDYEISPEDFAEIVPRIEYRLRSVFDSAYFKRTPNRRIIANVFVYCHKANSVRRVRLIYDHHVRQVVTALPQKARRQPIIITVFRV